MRKVRLSHAARLMDLLEDDLLLRTMQGTPGSDAALKSAKLTSFVAVGVLLAQESEEGLSLNGAVTLEMSLDPGPIVGEWIRASAIRAGLFELRRQLASAQVLAGGRNAHASPGSSLVKGLAFGMFADHAVNLAVSFHGRPPQGAIVGSSGAEQLGYEQKALVVVTFLF
jgi:hypothetical protein